MLSENHTDDNPRQKVLIERIRKTASTTFGEINQIFEKLRVFHKVVIKKKKVSSKNSNPLYLPIFESLLILKDRPSLTSHQSSFPLPHLVHSLV